MIELAVSVSLLLAGTLVPLLLWTTPVWARRVALICGVSGSLTGLALALRLLAGDEGFVAPLPFTLAFGSASIGIDALSAFFLVPLFVLGALCTVYGYGYLQSHPSGQAVVGGAFFNLLILSMVGVLLARDAVVFLIAWELMTVTSYALMTLDHGEAEVRRAGFVYLIAGHLGVVALLGLFLTLGGPTASFGFAAMAKAAAQGPAPFIVALTLVGFGVKAGLVPLYVWLPEAHAAAPSHISAFMSGVLVKMGVYGILRMLGWLPPLAWLGYLLVGLGILGALLGIALALYQRDMKRSFAYSTVENVGLIVLGLGLAEVGQVHHQPLLSALGLAAALLHVWNHATMKGLLFLGAGSILHSTGSKDLEKLGGLLKRMPWTGAAIMGGAVAVAGLPPLNGFVSEFFLYDALLTGGLSLGRFLGLLAVLVAGGLALVGGLAALTFLRVSGIALLGEPRSEASAKAHESSSWMVAPLVVLMSVCLLISVFPVAVLEMFESVMRGQLGAEALAAFAPLVEAKGAVTMLSRCLGAVWLALLVAGLGTWLWIGRVPTSVITWSCGYLKPTARMQYTASSFAELFTELLLPKRLRPRAQPVLVKWSFPAPTRYSARHEDPLTRGFYEPFFVRWADRFSHLRWLQQGVLNAYLFYILAAVVLAMAWVSLFGGH